MDTRILEGGFRNPAIDAAHAFRSVMEAMARPGTLQIVSGATPPAPMSPAAGAIILTLCDPETPIHLAGAYETRAIRDWIAFHTSAPIAAAADCIFALGAWDDLQPLNAFSPGTPQYPDRSATLITECTTLANSGAMLKGPGIETTAMLSLPETRAFQENRALFPLGLDFLFTCDDRIAALPRTTEIP